MRRALFYVLSLVNLCGCAPGLIYTDITEPLDLNLRSTPVGTSEASLGTREVKELLSAAGIRIQWASCGIGEAALEGDIDKIYYADMQQISILLGLWSRNVVHVYGSPKDGKCPSAQGSELTNTPH